VQGSADGLRLSLQVLAQAFRHGKDPLAHQQRWNGVIDQVRRDLTHLRPGVARRLRPLREKANK